MTHHTLAPWGELVQDAPYPMTADTLLSLSASGADYELVEGRLVKMTPVGGQHGDILLELGAVLRQFVRAGSLGEVVGGDVGFILSQPGDPETVLAPDIAYVSASHAPRRGTPEWSEFWRTVPDLVVEIVSPSQYQPQMNDKARAWLAAGVRLVWVVWPALRRVDVWRSGSSEPVAMLGTSDTLDGQGVLPGLSYPLADLFP
jgi:Uma2 family endonuclease